MARKGKWLTGVTPEVAASEAARQALESRLYLVWRYLPLAALRSDEDPEYVHQLRVATRRAMAAVETFGEFLPRKRGEKLTSHLKKIRRAAGAARDSDVLLARLREQARQRPNPAWPGVLEHVETQRRNAQRPISRIHRHLERKQFGKRIEQFLNKVHFRRPGGEVRTENGHHNGHGPAEAAPQLGEPSFGEFARRSLRQVVDQMYNAAGEDLSDINALHQLRIRGKHLRYSMELLAGAFEPGLRDELYPIVERLQEKLGEVNDHAVGIDTIEKLKEAARAMAGEKGSGSKKPAASIEILDALVFSERTAIGQSQAAFLQWWTPQRAGELRHHFDEFLGSPAITRDAEPEPAADGPSAAATPAPEVTADQSRD